MGRPSQQLKTRPFSHLQLCVLLLVFIIHRPVNSDAPIASDEVALLDFQRVADPYNHLLSKSWISSIHYCKWRGVMNCTVDGRVTKLVLRDYGLNGSIASDTLSRLSKLVVLDLKGNRFTGRIPEDLSKLKFLQKVYLQNNQLSGRLHDSLGNLYSLRVFDISGNQLTGPIPETLLQHARIRILYLHNNLFTGTIPDIPCNEHISIVRFNVSNNKLYGEIPTCMAAWSQTTFIGNPGLCGKPLDILCPQHDVKRNRPAQIASIVVGVLMGMGLFIFLSVCARKILKRSHATAQSKTEMEYHSKEKKLKADLYSTDKQMLTDLQHQKPMLLFFEQDQKKYELDTLLLASAEVLGRGILGTTYKAALAGGVVVAVKRLRTVIMERTKEFDQQMSIIGSLKHPNILPLRAYYYSKDEKLLMYDYQDNGSLFIRLHGKENFGWKPLNWNSRIKIAQGIAKGLAHLHDEFSEQKSPHGNIKSSNILLDENLEARIADFGLAPLISNSTAESYLSGYKAPECKHSKMLTQTADIYNFGVLLLELLTGKLPFQSFLGGQGIDLPYWVSSVVRQEWTTEVFDSSAAFESATEEELVFLLQIAMSCVSPSPELRPSMRNVVEKIGEQLKLSAEEPAVSDSATTMSDYSEGPFEDILDSGDLDAA